MRQFFGNYQRALEKGVELRIGLNPRGVVPLLALNSADRVTMERHPKRSWLSYVDALPAGTNQFGNYFEIRDPLRGPNGEALRVKTIWMREHLFRQPLLLSMSKSARESGSREPVMRTGENGG
ncbi:MAG TPA: hypothetical protein VG146_19960 [Verrucomicrobiae bacterium]|nr:hypothetical protein [Verrucomicrobiae bacterium]